MDFERKKHLFAGGRTRDYPTSDRGVRRGYDGSRADGTGARRPGARAGDADPAIARWRVDAEQGPERQTAGAERRPGPRRWWRRRAPRRFGGWLRGTGRDG